MNFEQPLLSSALLSELQTILAHPKFDRYVSIEMRKRFIAALVRVSEFVLTTKQVLSAAIPRTICSWSQPSAAKPISF